MRARDIMTVDVETVAPDDDVSKVLTRLARVDFNGFPVVEDGRVVGIVTQGDLVDLFQPSDRTLWIPIGFPPFLESLTYGIDLSWDELDVGIDMMKNAGKPISEVMTDDVVTVGPDDDLDTILELISDDERNINRLPVVEDVGDDPGSDALSGDDEDGMRRLTDAGRLVGIIARQDVLKALKEERTSR